MNAKMLVVVAASLIAAPALADETHTNKTEAAGIGSGLAVGAILGGPVGAVVGAAHGGWVGDRFHRETTARVEVEQQYASAQSDLDALEREMQGSSERIAVWSCP